MNSHFSFRPQICYDAGGNPSPEIEFKGAVVALKKATDDVKVFAEQAQAEIKSLGKLTDETKANADKAIAEMGGLTTRLSDIEQKMARKGGSDEQSVRRSLGDVVVESDEMKARMFGGAKQGTVNLKIETKDITSADATWGAARSVTNSLVQADRQPFVETPKRPLTIRSLVSPGQTVSNNIEYAVQTVRTNNAAMVAEGATKPYSNYAWNLKSFPVRTLAHMVKASRQILDDAPGLRSIIDSEMRYGLDLVEETQLLYGDGTGQNLLGIVPQASAYSAPFVVGAGETGLDRIRLAILQGTLALFPMSGIVLNPTDFAKLEVLKNAGGEYLIGDPQGTIQPRLWGLPVVSSLSMTANTFLVGAFAYGAQIFDRMQVEVAVSTENATDFEQNLVSIRCEERLSLVVKRPSAFVTGTLP